MAKGEKRMANEVNDLDSLFKQFAKKAEADAKKALLELMFLEIMRKSSLLDLRQVFQASLEQ